MPRELLGRQLMRGKAVGSVDGLVVVLAGIKAQDDRLDGRLAHEVTLSLAVAFLTGRQPIVKNAIAAEALGPDVLHREFGVRILLGDVELDAAQVAPTVLAARPYLESVALPLRRVMLRTLHRPQRVPQEVAGQ